MSRKKQRLSIFDLGRIPVSPTKYADEEKPTTTLRQFRADEARREREVAAAREAKIEQVNKDTSRLMAECLSVSAPLMAKFWSSGIDNIKAHLHDDDVFDNLFLPTSEEKTEPNAIYDAIQAFLDDDVFERGYSLSDISRRRFGLYVASQVNAGVIVNPASLAVMYDRCFELGIFKDDSGTEFNESIPRIKAVVEQPRVEEPVEQPRRDKADDLMSLGNSRQDQQKAMELLNDAWILEWLPLAEDWVSSIQRHWGFTPSQDDLKRVARWVETNNLSHRDARTYDAARRHLVSAGYWPESCLTNEERLNIEISQEIETSRMTVAQRNDLNRRVLQAREADARRFGHA